MKKLLSLGLVLILCLSMFAGCGKKTPTAKEILEGMNAVKPDSFSVTADIVADADVLLSGAPLNFKAAMDYDIDAELSDDALSLYMDVAMDVAVVGQKQNMKMNAYYVMNDAGTEMYMQTDELGSGWYKADAAQAGYNGPDFSTLKEMMKSEKKPIDDNDPLLKSTVTEEEKNGVKCYKLACTGDFGELADEAFKQLEESGMSVDQLMQQIQMQTGMNINIDIKKVLSEVKYSIEIYVAKDDYAPVSMRFDLSDTDIEAVLKACGVDLNSLAAGFGVEITGINVNDLYFQIDFNKINGVTVEVPADVVANAISVN